MSLESTLVGNVTIVSGKLLIVDPSYLNDFERIDAPLPPFVKQRNGYIVFSNPEGDGEFPIVKKPNGAIEVIFDYPIKWTDDTHFEIDKSKLDGEYLGESAVDSGMLLAIDASRVKLARGVDSSLYCTTGVKNGNYQCKFNRTSSGLLIKRLSSG